jgi:hypothetical protein
MLKGNGRVPYVGLPKTATQTGIYISELYIIHQRGCGNVLSFLPLFQFLYFPLFPNRALCCLWTLLSPSARRRGAALMTNNSLSTICQLLSEIIDQFVWQPILSIEKAQAEL